MFYVQIAPHFTRHFLWFPEALSLPDSWLMSGPTVWPQERKMESYFTLTQQREIRDCCDHLFTWTWLHPGLPDQAGRTE